MTSTDDVFYFGDKSLRKIFDEIDVDKSGLIDDKELAAAMSKIGVPCSDTFAIEKFTGT